MDSPFAFYEPGLPSANAVLVRGERPVLIDSGFGSDVADLVAWLRAQGTPPETLSVVVNTHHHSDHVGGNHVLQRDFGVEVAAHAWEADLINRRAPEAWSARWLDQPVEPYDVRTTLRGGEVIDTGAARLQVIHTPGHSLGHVSLFDAERGVLICGDTVHRRDVAWINPFLEGAGAIDRLIGSLETLAALPVRVAYTGHGPALSDFAGEVSTGLSRLTRWRDDPEKYWWHGLKRTFAFALMLRGGLTDQEVRPFLLARDWLRDYAARAFLTSPETLAEMLLSEMERSGAARREDGEWRATLPHRVPDAAWLARHLPSAAFPEEA